MGVKNNPLSLYNLSLQKVAQLLLKNWRDAFYTDYNHYSEEFKSNIGIIIPYTIYDQVFDIMVDSHARVIQNDKISDIIPSVPSLLDSIILSNLHKLNLNCLRHIGTVKDEEIKYLENILLTKLPTLSNLVEVCLQTSGTDFTLPTCTDEMLIQIGVSCPKLKALDISYNHTVTDTGLEGLLPNTNSGRGCPLLAKVSLFECSVTVEGASMLLEGLPRLKFLGYRETGQSLWFLNRSTPSKSVQVKKLELAHLNNLGIIGRTCKDLFKLKCDEKLINNICMFCPKLSGLKVRINDSDVPLLQQIKTITILELVYNLGTPLSPGSNTVKYLHLSGSQFVSLSLVCDTFSTEYLKVVCEQCLNLKRLWIRSNKFICDRDITVSDKRKCCLSNLEVFFFRVGCSRFEVCTIPHSVINYVLHKSNTLIEVFLAMKNPLICDSYVHDLFTSVCTLKIRQIMIVVPNKNVTLSSLNLSMATVESLMCMCPQLQQIGNLLVWDVSLEEIQDLRRRLKHSNSALVLLYRLMYS